MRYIVIQVLVQSNMMNIIIEVNVIQLSDLIEKISKNRNSNTFLTELMYHD